MKVTRKLKFAKKYISNSLFININYFKEIFSNDETIRYRYIENETENSTIFSIKAQLIYTESMVDNQFIIDNIITPLTESKQIYIDSQETIIEQLANRVIVANDVKVSSNIDKLTQAVVCGNTVLLLEGSNEALIIDTQGWKSRSIEEPEAEKTLRGPKEGFTEAIMINVSMVKRKLQTPNLKFEFDEIGLQTKTKVALCYVKGIVNEGILIELRKRLQDIEIDGIFDSGYIQELIKDEPLSPYKTIGTTERPDVVAAKILEGRIALLVDGTPVALTIPHLFIEYFQSPDDYYKNFYYSSFNRLMRIAAYFISFALPALYIAITTYHQEMIPTPLLLNIFNARQGIPFPAILEALLLLFAFEVLRETGTRMPTYIGQAMSIVGALVLGQAAVEARFVSAPMVIVIAMSGITGLMLPALTGSMILLRVFLIFVSSLLGMYGFVFGLAAVLIHLLNLRSFGVPYMTNINIMDLKNLQDTAVRMPWWFMKNRPEFIAIRNKKRQNAGRVNPK
ncbi:spore germination protein [Desulfuribacillus alkaliarsenatis]|uniref:Spore gernimation protein KA n=1 Tax=Desulfuribacillus alkaliarsenatis TaxID=766136 RepID=A0A1E5FYI6_9FIRM|nr:spore germination protein [Desulfuribacillus alkaliarsenatis]OEF95632.1 spore gernimation protein KA [Desulfuribacillus alkaliarsenatis]